MRLPFQGENGDLKNRSGLKVEINHIAAGSGDKANPGDNFPDSSIGEGMDITIQGANGHVKHNDTQSLRSHDSQQQHMETLPLPELDDKLNYSDMSIGMGMDISIRGDGDGPSAKDTFEDDTGWNQTTAAAGAVGAGADVKNGSLQFDNDNDIEYDQSGKGGDDGDDISINPDDIKNVKEVLLDPVDDIVVEDCCPEVCYRVCPCCIGDPDSPFWQLWFRHRLQVSRYIYSTFESPFPGILNILFF